MTRAEILAELDNLYEDIKRPTRNATKEENCAPIQFSKLHDWSTLVDKIIASISRGDIK